MDNKKLAELMKDETFVAKIMQAANKEEVKSFFKERGMELTEEDVTNLSKMIAQAVQKSENLSKEELENISGGNSRGGITISDSDLVAGGIGAAGATAVIMAAVGLYKLGYIMGSEIGWWNR